MEKLTKRQENKLDKQVEQAYYKTCTGVQIDIFDIPKVFKHGRNLLAQGADQAALETGIKSFVDTIRKN